jgi:hypothetical protein
MGRRGNGAIFFYPLKQDHAAISKKGAVPTFYPYPSPALKSVRPVNVRGPLFSLFHKALYIKKYNESQVPLLLEEAVPVVSDVDAHIDDGNNLTVQVFFRQFEIGNSIARKPAQFFLGFKNGDFVALYAKNRNQPSSNTFQLIFTGWLLARFAQNELEFSP